MEPVDEPLQKARQKIIGFRIHYGIAWEDFQKLEKFQAKYRGLTARRWVEVIQRDVKPNGVKRQLTIDLSELMDASPAIILHWVHHQHRDRSAPLLKQAGFRETPHAAASETLAKDMIGNAGNGLAPSAAATLLEAFERDWAHHPDEAMAPLRALVYVSSRYLKPQPFIRSVDDHILRNLRERRNMHSVDPVLRGQVIAQIAGYLLDHGSVADGERLLHHPKVKAMLESSWVADQLKWQMHRELAVVEAYSSNRFERARACIKDATASGDARSVRSSAIAMNTTWRLQGRFDRAYGSMEGEYHSSLKTLSVAAAEKRIDVGSLAHHFICVLRGSLCRFIHEAKNGGHVDLDKEIHVLRWMLNGVKSLPLETSQFQPLPDDVRLPPDLEVIRNQCRSPILADFQVQSLLALVQALDV